MIQRTVLFIFTELCFSISTMDPVSAMKHRTLWVRYGSPMRLRRGKWNKDTTCCFTIRGPVSRRVWGVPSAACGQIVSVFFFMKTITNHRPWLMKWRLSKLKVYSLIRWSCCAHGGVNWNTKASGTNLRFALYAALHCFGPQRHRCNEFSCHLLWQWCKIFFIIYFQSSAKRGQASIYILLDELVHFTQRRTSFFSFCLQSELLRVLPHKSCVREPPQTR